MSIKSIKTIRINLTFALLFALSFVSLSLKAQKGRIINNFYGLKNLTIHNDFGSKRFAEQFANVPFVPDSLNYFGILNQYKSDSSDLIVGPIQGSWAGILIVAEVDSPLFYSTVNDIENLTSTISIGASQNMIRGSGMINNIKNYAIDYSTPKKRFLLSFEIVEVGHAVSAENPYHIHYARKGIKLKDVHFGDLNTNSKRYFYHNNTLRWMPLDIKIK